MSRLPKSSQKSWLTAVKRGLSRRYPDLTWDDFARLAEIDPRAFKTYRMPERSENYRTMPDHIHLRVEKLLERESDHPPGYVADPIASGTSGLLIQSLAALVVRLARISLIEERMVAGGNRIHGSPVGLTPEDQKAMALVSRACLTNGLPDRAAEIHDLLALCARPLGEWLPVPEVAEAGLSRTAFIHAEEGIPTAEAEELAAGFGCVTAGLEEQLFAKLIELLGRFPDAAANNYYTTMREFVVRHPVCTPDELQQLGGVLASHLWILLQQQFYEPVPSGWATADGVPLCAHCGNAMKKGVAGLVCRTLACAAAASARVAKCVPVSNLLRASRGIRQYWIEPGIDEIRLFDALKGRGIAAELYPFRDRVDISVGDIGVDLKTYASPETLGLRFRRGIGGLAYYATRLVVVPDWQVAVTPSYLDRLRAAIGREDVRCLSVSGALDFLTKGGARA